MKTLEDRFWAKVEKTETCWNWTASTCRTGYGRIGVGRTVLYSHRIAYEFSNGPIQAGMELDHTCHNRRCVNPSHLRPVTHQQNGENRGGAQANSATGVRGVHWHKPTRKYQAAVVHRQKKYYVGLFPTLAEAEAAVIAKCNELHTHNDLDRISA